MDSFKSGFVALVGRPNVGKSTLLNTLVKEKIAIVSDKPQTTRFRVRGVVNIPEQGQIVFVDTPGFHKPKDSLGVYLNDSVKNALKEVDVIVMLLDASQEIGRGDKFLAEFLQKFPSPKLAVLNKIDKVSPNELKKQISRAQELGDFKKIVPISALRGENVEELIKAILEYLPEGPPYYPEGMTTDQPLELRIKEIIREKALHLTYEEVPHSVAVEVDEMVEREDKDILEIYATIYVERDSQKGIIIGKEGRMLKEIGKQSRLEIESLVGKQVFLSLKVKVKKGWRKDSRAVEFLY